MWVMRQKYLNPQKIFELYENLPIDTEFYNLRLWQFLKRVANLNLLKFFFLLKQYVVCWPVVYNWPPNSLVLPCP